jgi:hypothetical protein
MTLKAKLHQRNLAHRFLCVCVVKRVFVPKPKNQEEKFAGKWQEMAYIEVLGVEVLDNPAKFADDLKFKITFNCKIKPQEGIRM